MTKMQSTQEARHRGGGGRSLRAALILGALVAALTMATAGPAAGAGKPTVTRVQPSNGPPAGGTSVTITGTNFTGATAVKFGPTNATSFSVNSESSITAVSPPFTGGNALAEVTVTTPAGTSELAIGDTFGYEPTVTAVSPSTGTEAGGTSVTITGTGFEGFLLNGAGEMPPFVASVNFGSTQAASFKVNSETSITAVAPPGTGTVDATVRTLSGTSPTSSADRFTYLVVPEPIVTGVEPKRGWTGTAVTITGTKLSGATAVKFGPTNATSFTVNSASSITAVAPAGTGLVDVTVTTPAGTSPTSSFDQFTYQAPPTVGTCTVEAKQTSARLCATVNPNGGNVTECKFEYGTTEAYGSSAPCASLPGSGTSPVEVHAEVVGLSPNTTYHFRISVTNAGGTSTGADQSFKTALPVAPTLAYCAAKVTQTTATLCATVNPNLGNVTECRFAFGATILYTASVPCTPSPGSGNSPVTVTATVIGLTPNTTYHYAIIATNAGGEAQGADQTLKTLPTAAPSVETTAPAAVTRTLATMNGTVNPNGLAVSDCHFDYGPTTSYGSTAPCASPPGSGESVVAAVAASLGNLSPGSTYHFRISATNADGTSTGSDQTFATLTALPTPHWYKNGTKVPLGEKSNLIGWGTLTLESSAGTATCHTAQVATVENTAGAARKEVGLFATWECKPVGGSCTGGEQRATPGHLPWQGTMLEEGVEGSGEFREEGWGIELNLECFKGGVNTSNMLFKTGPVLAETGIFTPRWLNGTSATKPSEASFDLSSGHLDAQVAGAAVQGTTKGKVKFVGYQDNAPTPLITLTKP